MGDTNIQWFLPLKAGWDVGAQLTQQRCGELFTPLIEDASGEMVPTSDCVLGGVGGFLGGRVGLGSDNFFIGLQARADGVYQGFEGMQYTGQAEDFSTMHYLGVGGGGRMDVWRLFATYSIFARQYLGAHTPYAYTDGDRVLPMPGTTQWEKGVGNMLGLGYRGEEGLLFEVSYGQMQNTGRAEGEERVVGERFGFGAGMPGQTVVRIGYSPKGDQEPKTAWYLDLDNDTYGAKDSEARMSRSQPEGYVADHTDCNDNCAECYPGAEETVAQAGDNLDQDCNGSDAHAKIFYQDKDGDGWGVLNQTKKLFVATNVWVEKPGDCDDGCARCFPGAEEVPNDGIDQDCDGSDLVAVSWHEDRDSDGFGSNNPSARIDVTDSSDPNTTEGVTIAYVQNNTDCNDNCEDCHPGGTEVADNDLDEDCDGTVLKNVAPVVIQQTDRIQIERTILNLSKQINFKKAKAELLSETLPSLDQLAQILHENPGIVSVEIAGHTSSEGSEEYNQVLSQSRAESVMRYLIEMDVAAERLTATGYGEGRPFANDTGGTHSVFTTLNRRVEINLQWEGVERIEE